jgi:hypothetical protein
LLEPALRSLEASNVKVDVHEGTEETAPTSDWSGQVLHLFRAIKRMERLTAFLFAGARLSEEPDDQAVAKLLASFDQIDQKSHRLAEHVDRSRSDRPISATFPQER